jgi:hypothetical protein
MLQQTHPGEARLVAKVVYHERESSSAIGRQQPKRPNVRLDGERALSSPRGELRHSCFGFLEGEVGDDDARAGLVETRGDRLSIAAPVEIAVRPRKSISSGRTRVSDTGFRWRATSLPPPANPGAAGREAPEACLANVSRPPVEG